jgi:hypothetical protein
VSVFGFCQATLYVFAGEATLSDEDRPLEPPVVTVRCQSPRSTPRFRSGPKISPWIFLSKKGLLFLTLRLSRGDGLYLVRWRAAIDYSTSLSACATAEPSDAVVV